MAWLLDGGLVLKILSSISQLLIVQIATFMILDLEDWKI